MPAFGNPVQGIIRPPGSPLILGNFRVVCDFACHEGRNPPTQGTDIGDGTCGEPILAMTSGTISLLRLGKVGSTLSSDASIFRIKRPDGWEPAVAHLRIKAGLAVGQAISEGTVIGTLDKVGATACHVHVGCKDPGGTEVDVWPMLRQNGATEENEDVLQGANPARIVNRQTTVKGDNTNFRASPATNAPVLVQYDAGTLLYPDYLVQGAAAGGTTGWFGVWADTPQGRTFCYLHESTVSPLTPIEQSGHSDAELAAAAKLARANGISDAAKAAGAVV